ncbi:MAG: heme lyase CcmF/NrfE family subunit [Candidatus Tectomicrobia bacterium]|nr:heme lyase CcmF/NrfE family subunit [Candidatus Tectomicrobia bacterium]
MGDVGYFAVWLGGALAAYAMVSSFVGGRWRRPVLVESARNAIYALAAVTTLAVFSLEVGLVTDDFSLNAVAGTSSRSLGLFYKVTSLWGGQAGSLLFWAWLLSLYSAIALYTNRDRNRELIPYVLTTLGATASFFFILLMFFDNPFQRIIPTPADGRGLNPILQDPGMAFHPPNLYLGYVGWSIPFAFAMGALATGRLGEEWIRSTRRWCLIAWCFLGIGNLLGAWWAYRELGWGGYWGWDPVENSAILPWITGTAFLHSVMIQEKKGMLKVWNLVLLIMTFTLTIFGTFVVRSGVISSVHAFAQSALGYYFAIFIFLIIAVSLALLFWRLDSLQSPNRLESMLSRESAFLFNNLILVGAAFSIWWGTVFPLISEAVTGTRITIGPPFFNRVNVPIGLAIILLTGVGPLIAWRKASAQQLRKHFLLPLAVGFATGGVLFAFGMRSFLAVLSFSLIAFVLVTVVDEFYRGTRARQRVAEESAPAALLNLTRRNTRRYGGYVVHLGMMAIFAGITGSSAFQTQVETTLRPGELTQVKDYWVEFRGVRSRSDEHVRTTAADLGLRIGGREIALLRPERRLYRNPEQPTTETAIRSTLREDFYVILAGVNDNGSATLRFYVNPLVSWIWIGGAVIVLGTLLAMWPAPHARRVRAPAAARARERVREEMF